MKQNSSRNLLWITEKKFIHRGRISQDVYEHTRNAYSECIKRHYPMEVDLLFLKDNSIVVWRDAPLTEYGFSNTKLVSECTIDEINTLKKDASVKDCVLNGIMEFGDFLSFVNGTVDLLIEIKYTIINADDIELEKVAQAVIERLKNYKGRYAIHSANPYILKKIKAIDADIPCGQISWDFDGVDIDEGYRQLHLMGEYVNIVEPDFISYKIQNLKEDLRLRKMIHSLCLERNIKCLAWTVKNISDEQAALELCDNMIIEGAVSFLND